MYTHVTLAHTLVNKRTAKLVSAKSASNQRSLCTARFNCSTETVGPSSRIEIYALRERSDAIFARLFALVSDGSELQALVARLPVYQPRRAASTLRTTFFLPAR